MEIITEGPHAGVPTKLGQTADKEQLLNALTSYKDEAKQARKSGLNPRDEKWAQNLDLYWNRYDFSNKAEWQAKETMPEVPGYVDRFAAAMKEALIASPTGFYDVYDPKDEEGDLAGAIKRVNDIWLDGVGTGANGEVLGFPAFFEEQMKMGVIMATAATVTWDTDTPNGRVRFDTVDPRTVWLDHTGRGLYRIRQTEIDRHDLVKMATMKTASGKALYHLPEMERLLSYIEQDRQREREESSGSGQEVLSGRAPIMLDEYVATVVNDQGKLIADKSMMVVANEQFLIRGPEKNPFWHGKDWLLYAPLVTAPLSIYGRSYMEDFGGVAKVFTDLTNLLLDAAYTSAINAFVMVPEMLTNPEQANTGIWPNKTFLLDGGYDARQFAAELNLGSLEPGLIQMWTQLKNELSEAAGINEIGLGQFAPKGRTSATEISATQQSSSAIVRSVAQTVEARFLNPMLDMGWRTGIQHAKRDDRALAEAAGPELWAALMKNRRELVKHPHSFRATGISAMIKKAAMLQQLLQLLQVVGQNEHLVAAFMQEVDINRLLALLFDLSNIDPTRLEATTRDRMVRSALEPLQAAAQGGTPTPGGTAAMQQATNAAGIGRQQ